MAGSMVVYCVSRKERLIHAVLGLFLVLSLGACDVSQQTDPPRATATPPVVVTYIPPAVPPDVQERGFSLIPNSPDDYGSKATLHALEEMRDLGANAVNLVTTYYTDTLTSSTIHTGRYKIGRASCRER